jgi:hypothetical protein
MSTGHEGDPISRLTSLLRLNREHSLSLLSLQRDHTHHLSPNSRCRRMKTQILPALPHTRRYIRRGRLECEVQMRTNNIPNQYSAARMTCLDLGVKSRVPRLITGPVLANALAKIPCVRSLVTMAPYGFVLAQDTDRILSLLYYLL